MAGETKSASNFKSSPLVKVFNCQGCGASIKITAIGQSLIAVCSACGTTVDATDENFKVLTQHKVRIFDPPVIKLGTRGKLHGAVWECIGYMERTDTKSYSWREYLLFNPQKGFRWLSENSGHWSWIKTTKSHAKDYHWGVASYLNKNYKIFHIGHAKIKYIAGEFYWRAQVGDVTEVKDYISPPEILSMEKSQNEIIWSLGEYIDSDSVKKAFAVEKMPAITGIAPNQPWDIKKSVEGIMSIWGLFVMILFVLQVVALSRSPSTLLTTKSFEHYSNPPDVEVKNFVTEEFKLSGRNKNVEVTLSAPVENDWFSAEFELVNDDTGGSQVFEIGVEHYHGYDGGEYWSEGSKTSSFLLENVPNGNYHLNVSSMASKSSSTRFPFVIKVVRGVPEWSTFLWYLFWISLVPLLILWLKRSFERGRWIDSDFSPYHGQDDE
jgi:hypothetical protein